MYEPLQIKDLTLNSRLIIGTGKYPSYRILQQVIEASGVELVTVAVRRIDLDFQEENILNYIPANCRLLPNTSGARNAEEAVRIARLARASGCGDLVKLEVINDNKYLLPDSLETLRATELLVKEGFTVLPYISPDLSMAKRLAETGAAAVMPLGAPIGSNRGIKTKELIRILIDEISLPIIVDAGIGRPAEAAESMEMGAAAIMLNTAIATAGDPIRMAQAFSFAVQAGRLAYLAGLGPVHETADASSPLTGFLR